MTTLARKSKAVVLATKAPAVVKPRTEAEEQLVAEWKENQARLRITLPRFQVTTKNGKPVFDAAGEMDVDLWDAKLARAFGNSLPAAQNHLLNQLLKVFLPDMTIGAGVIAERTNAALGALHGIAPKDTLEALLAVQMVATQKIAIDLLAAGLPSQTTEEAQFRFNHAARLMRLFLLQMDALQRYRGKGPSEQRVVVEHVHVHAGGQAIVGSVSATKKGTGGRGAE
jgi:hypothetical protein